MMREAAATVFVLGLLGHLQCATGQESTPRLRFDGLYDLRDPNSRIEVHSLIRLTEAGDAYVVTLPTSAPDAAASWSFWRNATAKGRYELAGNVITIEVKSDRCKGTVEDGVLRLECTRGPGASGLYRFVALEFDRPSPIVRTPAASEKTAPAGVSSDSAPPMQVALGTTKWRTTCDDLMFVPPPQPAVFPKGTSEVAIQLKKSPESFSKRVTASVVLKCQQGAQSKRCSTYAIVSGQAQESSWTGIFSCLGGEPIQTGSYELVLRLDDVIVRRLPFQVQ